MSLAANIGATDLHETACAQKCVNGPVPARPILAHALPAFSHRLHLASGWLFLLLIALLVYRPLLPGSLIMDDLKLIQWDNPIVNGTLGPASIWFRADFPLSTLALWLQWLAWGTDP